MDMVEAQEDWSKMESELKSMNDELKVPST
jgi:hypothetical protein